MPTSDQPASSFAALDAAFQLLCAGPNPLAIDGAAIGHGLPARAIPLTELNVLLQHPATSMALRQAVVDELFGKARQHRSAWTVGLGGVLLPGLRRIAVALAGGHHGHAGSDAKHDRVADAELEVLRHFHAAIQQPPTLEPVGGRPRHPLVITLALALLTATT